MKKFQTVLNKTRLPGKQLISPRSARYNAALPVIPGLLLATTGLIAPDTLQAETQRCDSESTVLCSEGRQKAAVGQSQKLAAVSVKPDNGRMVINQGTTVTLSADKNTDAEWNNFNGLTVGSVTEGDLIVDGRTIGAKAGTIGQGSRGSVLLTHGAGWQMGAHLVLGTENGDGSVRVEDGSYITGIRELRIGEFYEGATGAMVITGENSSVAAASGVVGDKGVGRLDILDGGRLSIAGQMNIGYVGNTNTSQSKGNGTVNVEGAGSTLETGNGLIFGGFSEDKNDAKGELIVSDSGRVKADGFLWLGIGSGSTGIVNVGGRQGEAARQAGSIETPLIFLGNRINHDSLAVLNFNHTSEDYTLSAQIRGDGVVSHEGPGTTLLSGSNDWSGRATVSNGTLRAGSSRAFSSNADFSVAEKGTLDLNGYSQNVKSLTLGGTLSFGTPKAGRDPLALAGSVFTVSGDYVGDNGLLILNTAEDSAQQKSLVNQLHVQGSTSGTTRVALNELGTAAVSDLNGAQVVRVDGASDGEFVAQGRLVAGAWDYALQRGANTEESAQIPDSNHWYLTNTWTPAEDDPEKEPIPGPQPEPDPQPAPDPAPESEPVPQPEPQPESVPVPQSDPVTPDVPVPQPEPGKEAVYRPEMGAYLANSVAANTLFNTRLYDRLGETEYIDPVTGESRVTSLWLRNVGGHTRFRDTSGQLRTQSNRYVVQLGGDVAQWSAGLNDRWHLGVMAGYANSQSNTRSSISGYRADGTVSGYSAGFYLTWYADRDDKDASYVDAWMLYNWFDNSVSGDGLPQENYRSRGITASLEAGHAFLLAEQARLSYWLQPQAQLTWMGVSADDRREANGTRVRDQDKGNLQSRLGVKAWLRGHSQRDEGKDRMFQPFVEANWLHNTRSYAVSMNEIEGKVDGARNIAEVRAGVEAKVNTRLHLWGNVGQQIGDSGYSDTQAVLGIKLVF